MKVTPPCVDEDYSAQCNTVTVTVDASSQRVTVPPQVAAAGLVPGDELSLMVTPDGVYSYFEVQRGPTLWMLAFAFALVVVAVARLRGLMALVGLGVAGAVAGWFILPALLIGEPPVAVAVCGSVVIMFIVLYTTHGLSLRTSVALAGTLAGVGITAAIAWFSVGQARLSGVADEGGGLLLSVVSDLSLQDVLVASVVIAGLGALNDVTITQASAVWELRQAAPHLSRWTLWNSGMRIGRDHVASTIYTLAFAYMGAALTLLLAVQLYDRSLFSLISSEEIAEEVVRSLAGGIGVVLAMPITTLIAVLVVSGAQAPAPTHLHSEASA
ncbi:hypothetical protein BH09ACT11_BH09ACT11_11150 [soil metagenome]